MAEKKDYGADDITVLEGLDAVRKRPGMYIGSTGETGLHHLVYEVVDNSVDEALAGHCDEIDVTILKDGAVRVIDNGRGIPVEKHKTEKKSTLEVVLTILHAGGKFGGGGYAISGGLHGVGISVVNALSKKIEAIIKRDGFTWKMTFIDGKKEAELQKLEPTKKTGTQITFWPDDEIFETTKFDFETLKTRFQQMAFINKGLKINLKDERDDAGENNEVSFLYNNGLIDYVEHLNKLKRNDLVNDKIIYFEVMDDQTKMSVQIALQWTTGYTESVYSFANTINTTEGGMHEEGFRTALTSVVNKFAKDTNILKESDENLSGNDVREGLTAVLSLKLLEPQFEGQTKTKLGNTEARSFVQKVINTELTSYFDANPPVVKDICRKALQAASARIAARKAREATRRKGLMDGAGMPGKLRDCSSRNAELCEIFIVEGDSAGGSAVRGRNPEIQAIMPLRGKPLNVEKVRLDKALGNKEIQSMITAFGTGIGEDFDSEKLRYNKIILMADADVDGSHIQTLLLTFLFRYTPQLIEEGHVYLAQPPLYRLKWSNSAHEFAFSDSERDEMLENGKKEGKKIAGDNAIQRYKGLGEMNYEELWDTTMDPGHRSLLQVSMESAAEADEIFSILMGDDVSARKSFIQNNAKDVRFLDI